MTDLYALNIDTAAFSKACGGNTPGRRGLRNPRQDRPERLGHG